MELLNAIENNDEDVVIRLLNNFNILLAVAILCILFNRFYF